MTAPIAVRNRVGAVSVERAHVELGGRRVATACAILGLAGLSFVLAVTSDHVQHPAATGLYYAGLVGISLLAALYWRIRRPSNRFGLLLAAFGATTWVVSLQSADWPLLFDVAVLAEGVMYILTYHLFLAFPSGRLETTTNRLLIAALVVAAAATFLPWALLMPVIGGGGPLGACAPACPRNVLQVATEPDAVVLLGRWGTYLMLAVTVVVLCIYWRRIVRASRPMRRALFSVAATSLLFLPMVFAFHFSHEFLNVDPATLSAMGWVLTGMLILLPLGFVVALLQAELFAGAARGRLLEQLLRRPSPQQWRDAVAVALDDRAAELAYWDPLTDCYRRADGDELTRPPEHGPRSWVRADRAGRPVAALVLDNALAGDPELVRAAASATVLAVEQGALEGELRSSRARIVEAGDAERRRIERDLHDSAQQRLVALRIHLEIAGAKLEGPEQREMVERLGLEVDEAIDDLRSVASGVYPAVLTDGGVTLALQSVARHAALPVAVLDRGIGRHPAAVEATVYFCCVEAVQNATKHAGVGASVKVSLGQDDGHVAFAVEDDGRGFDRRTARGGSGITNIADRLATAGGTLTVESAPSQGTRISGRIPVAG